MASRMQYELDILLGARRASSFESNVNGASNGLESIGKTAKRVAGVVTAAFAAVNVTSMVGDAMDTYVDYEQSLANTAAIAQATATEYDQLEQAAREAGKSTTKTAQESADALGYMALAGWDVSESTQGLMPVLKLSEATQLDLAETSDLVTDSMSALKLNVDELPQYLDTVVQGNNKANMTSQQMMQSMILAGGAARSLGIGYQDLGSAIGILANNGTKGNKSGTAMNAMLTRMASNDTAIKQMKKLKISVFDAEGSFVGLENALQAINAGISGLTEEEQAAALKNIAGTQYYSKMIYLLDSVKEGADGTSSAWDELNAQLYDSTGALDVMDTKVTGTTSGAIQRMQSALDDVKISFGDAFNEEYIGILDSMGSGFNDLSGWIQDFSEDHAVEIHEFFVNMEEHAEDLFEILGNGIEFVVDNIDAIESGLVGIGSAVAFSKVATGVLSVVNAFKLAKDTEKEVSGLALVIRNLSSPTGLAVAGSIAAATAATAAIAGVSYSVKKAHERAVEANLEEHFGNIALSLDQIDDAAQQIVGRKNLAQISTMMESIGKTDALVESMADGLSTINKIEWKLKAGLKLDQDDQDTYIANVQQYIQNAQDIVDSQGYTVSIATNLLLGKNSDIGIENNEFFAGLDSKLSKLETKLNKKINKAVEKGVSIDTDQSIQKLLGQIDEITSAVTVAQNDAALDAIMLEYSGKDLDANTINELSKKITEYEKQVTEGAGEAYEASMTNLHARLSLGDISQDEYDAEKSQLEQGYFQTKADAYMNGFDYLMNSITSAYPEVASAMDALENDLSSQIKEAMDSGLTGDQLYDQLNGIAESAINNLDISDKTSDTILGLFENGLNDIYSSMIDLQAEMSDAGMAIPEEFSAGIKNADAMQALSGSTDDMLYLVGDEIGASEAYTTVVATAEKTGGNIPEGIAAGIAGKKGEVAAAVDSLYDTMLAEVNGKSLYTGTINITTSTAESSVTQTALANSSPSKSTTYKDHNGNEHTIYKNALGGIYGSEILTTVAEEGPEAIIPLDGSSRAKSLLTQAASALGFGLLPISNVSRDQALVNDFNSASSGGTGYSMKPPGTATGEGYQITYAPQITITGNADQNVVSQALEIGKSKFDAMMKQWMAEQKRIKFG